MNNWQVTNISNRFELLLAKKMSLNESCHDNPTSCSTLSFRRPLSTHLKSPILAKTAGRLSCSMISVCSIILQWTQLLKLRSWTRSNLSQGAWRHAKPQSREEESHAPCSILARGSPELAFTRKLSHPLRASYTMVARHAKGSTELKRRTKHRP